MALPTSAGNLEVIGTLDDSKRGTLPSGIHTDAVFAALIQSCESMEKKLAESLKNYQQHPDVQANLQQLQYDLQQWNLALTTMTNIQKNMGDALASIASNFR